MQLDQCESVSESGRPRSCSGYLIGLIGLMGYAAGVWAATAGTLPTAVRVLVLVSITAVPMVIWALWVDQTYLRESAGLTWRRARPRNIGRVYIMFVGLA